ncbi:MAG TPA: histidine kinase dimerization/phospho-acceptor domain-containing protein, partial [Burkholderiales bacterium]|nr:histidine kinase dimerization/phospho-acceptor domain-containing protein [Burkholderiales bacterium]
MSPTLADRAFQMSLPAPNAALLLSAAMVLLIASADALTGYELTLSILYFVPLFITAWRCGLQSAIVLAVFAVGAWMASDILAGHHYSHPFYRWWEALIKLATWVMFAALLARLRMSLNRSDERFVTVLEGLDAVVYVVDLHDATVLYANPQCRALIGGAPDTAARIESGWLPAPADTFAAARLLDARGTPHAGVTAEFRDAGHGRWYIVHARAIRWVDGRLVRLQVATDITDQREAQLQARERQGQMEKATRLIMLGEMASTLSHELSQPLAAIANYNRGALRRLHAGPCEPRELIDALEKCASQAERAGRIVHRVRDLVRRRQPQCNACSLRDMVDHVATTLEPDIARAEVRVDLDVPGDLPAVYADSVLIEQALLNLCRNAIESMRETPPGQRVLRISASAAENSVEIRIADTGCGIPDAVREDRYDLFFTT